MLANAELEHVAEGADDMGGEDQFYSNITGFCAGAAQEMEAIEHLFEIMQRRMYATTSYFGESNMSMDKLFEKLQQFLALYKDAKSEHGRLIKTDMLMDAIAS